MNFSIKATIRAFAAPEHRISCSAQLWKRILTGLDVRGERIHESGAFLLGVKKNRQSQVMDCIFYDELDPAAYESGVCMLSGPAFSKLWMLCRERVLTVVGDVHTHPGAARQSDTDRRNPMIARAGHIAIIVPRYAMPPVRLEDLGVYEYCGGHEWTHLERKQIFKFFYIGFWS